MSESTLLLGIGLTADPAAGFAQEVRSAERIGLNFVLLDDGTGSLDPLEAAAFAAAGTHSIALVATAAATHAEPFHLSNQFSSLDWGTKGRAGWLVTLDPTSARAQAYSAGVLEPEAARREAAAVLDAARRLWDSWEDGALIADSAGGRFLDHEKIHYVDVAGEFFSLKGPALMPRPVQGQVVVLGRYRDRFGDPDVTLVGGAAEAAQAREQGARKVFTEVVASPGLLTSLRRLKGHVDGVVVRSADPAEALAELERYVVPALVEDGTLQPPRPGQTLRDQLGLDRPASRYTEVRKAS